MNYLNTNFIGWFIAVFIIFPLLVYLYSKISINRNEGAKYYKDYISHSENINVLLPNYPELKSKYARYKTGFTIRGSARGGSINRLLFYNKEYKKHFAITLFDYRSNDAHGRNGGEGRFYGLSILLKAKQVDITVNKEDLENPNYGTEENPIPIFRVEGEFSHQYEGKYKITPQEYEHNVKTYLTYIMPKEEFKERFEKK